MAVLEIQCHTARDTGNCVPQYGGGSDSEHHVRGQVRVKDGNVTLWHKLGSFVPRRVSISDLYLQFS